jgi:hypothetical protein
MNVPRHFVYVPDSLQMTSEITIVERNVFSTQFLQSKALQCKQGVGDKFRNSQVDKPAPKSPWSRCPQRNKPYDEIKLINLNLTLRRNQERQLVALSFQNSPSCNEASPWDINSEFHTL